MLVRDLLKWLSLFTEIRNQARCRRTRRRLDRGRSNHKASYLPIDPATSFSSGSTGARRLPEQHDEAHCWERSATPSTTTPGLESA